VQDKKNTGKKVKTSTIKVYSEDLRWINDCCKKKNCNQQELIRKIKVAVESKHAQEFYLSLPRVSNFRKPLRDIKIDKNSKLKLKYNARKDLMLAVKSGELIRPEACSCCGAECVVDGHHTDYNKSKQVVWLCKKCHFAQHHDSKRIKVFIYKKD
jgi:hypothetical protein